METRRAFTPSEVCSRQGFDRIKAGLLLPADATEPLYQAFDKGLCAGDPKLQIKLITDVLAGNDWRWPWIEECAARIEAMGMWPLQWEAIQQPFEWDRITTTKKIWLLSHTIGKAAHTCYRAFQMRNVMGTFKPTVQTMAQCLPSAYFADMYRPAIEAGDLSNIPPFFPFDTNGLTSELRRTRY